MVTRDPVPFVIFHINWRASGWSERHYLPMLSWERAIALANELGRIRIAACCRGAKLIWARLAFTDRPNFTEPLRCIGLTSDGYPSMTRGHPEDPFMRLHYRYETADGRWNTRLFCGIPDDVVHEMRLTHQWGEWSPGDPPPDLDDALTSWSDIFRYMVHFVKLNTVYCRPVKDADPPARHYEPWNAVVFRKVANRNVGRDFLRVSWESSRVKPGGDPGVDPPWHAAPHFTPCGAAVGVVRSCYQRPCIWYRNGPVGRIRFYFVPESNPILWHRTVFWPYSQDLEISNVGRPGEQTNSPRRWDRGGRDPVEDGTHPTGTAADYAGESDVPWSPAVPSPEELLPRCDFEWLDPEVGGGVEVAGGNGLPPGIGGGVEVGGGAIVGELLGGGVEVGGGASFWPELGGGVEVEGGAFVSPTPIGGGVEVGGGASFWPSFGGGVEVEGGGMIAAGAPDIFGGGVEVEGGAEIEE